MSGKLANDDNAIRDAFNAIDKDGDGVLGAAEIAQLCAKRVLIYFQSYNVWLEPSEVAFCRLFLLFLNFSCNLSLLRLARGRGEMTVYFFLRLLIC